MIISSTRVANLPLEIAKALVDLGRVIDELDRALTDVTYEASRATLDALEAGVPA